MTKQEFDRLSMAQGFGPCADFMWEEVERMYSTSDLITKELAVDIYWHEPALYREIIGLRYGIARLLNALSSQTEGYAFSDVAGAGMRKLQDLHSQLLGVIHEAEDCMKGRAK